MIFSNGSKLTSSSCTGYLTVFDGGRLGNKMSQYATLLAHANRLGAKAVLSSWMRKELITHFPDIRYLVKTIHKSSV
jgi:tRNA(Phe) wybutosine-synthesizing methylase Tyw3